MLTFVQKLINPSRQTSLEQTLGVYLHELAEQIVHFLTICFHSGDSGNSSYLAILRYFVS